MSRGRRLDSFDALTRAIAAGSTPARDAAPGWGDWDSWSEDWRRWRPPDLMADLGAGPESAVPPRRDTPRPKAGRPTGHAWSPGPPPEPEVRLIAAVDEEGGLGLGDRLPWEAQGWRLADDLRRFKTLTDGCPVILGRRTYDGLARAAGRGKPVLPGRQAVVVTRRPWSIQADWGRFALAESSPGRALLAARRAASMLRAPAVWVAGGAAIYAALLPECRAAELTVVRRRLPADVRFPVDVFTSLAWAGVRRERAAARDADGRPVAVEFLTLRRAESRCRDLVPLARAAAKEARPGC